LPDGAKPLEFKDLDDLKNFANRLLSVPRLFDDTARNLNALARNLANPNTVFLELGNRAVIMELDSIRPGHAAFTHIVVFSRRRFPELENALTDALNWAFRTFKLKYINAWIPAFNTPALNLATRLGFVEEGILRAQFVYNGEATDAIVMSKEPI